LSGSCGHSSFYLLPRPTIVAGWAGSEGRGLGGHAGWATRVGRRAIKDLWHLDVSKEFNGEGPNRRVFFRSAGLSIRNRVLATRGFGRNRL
jgi:hypothetical protein